MEILENSMMDDVRVVARAKSELEAFRAQYGLSGENDQAPWDVLWHESRLKKEVNEYKFRLQTQTFLLWEDGAVDIFARVRTFYEQVVGEPYLSGYKYCKVTSQKHM